MSFYDVYGNEVSIESIRDNLINEYTGDATDFEDGSQIKNLFTALAVLGYDIEDKLNDILLQTNIDTADGEYLDTIAEQPAINLARNEGTTSTGTVIFTLNEAKNEDYLIEEGTLLVSGEFEFETLTDCIIEAGELSNTTTAESVDVGLDKNIEANTIELMDANVDYSVSNPYKFVDGSDYEEDEEFRERIMEQVQVTDFGSKLYYVNVLTNEFDETLHDVLITDCDCDYTGIVIPNTYYSDAQDTLTANVQAYLDTPSNILVGQSFVVNNPTVQEYSYRILSATDYTGLSSYDEDFYIVITDATYDADKVPIIKDIIEKYVIGGSADVGAPLEFIGLDLNTPMVLSELVGYFLEATECDCSFYDDDDNILTELSLNGKNKYSLEFVTDD